MKRSISLLLAAVLCLSLAACQSKPQTPVGSNPDATQSTNPADPTSPTQGDTTEPTQSATPADTYVGAFYKSGGGAHIGYMVTASGSTERLEEVYGYLSYTKDGQWTVWRDNKTVYKKQPGENPVTLSTNADDFYLNEDTGLLIVFCEDGVYATSQISQSLNKITDLSDGVYRTALSDDGKYLAYISDGALYLITLSTFDVKKLVDSDVDHGEYLICHSPNEIYYMTFENVRCCWNGSSVEEKYVPESDEKYECYSPNGKYAIGRENGKYWRYEFEGESIVNTKELGKIKGLYFVTDDGVAGVFSSGTVTVYAENNTYELPNVQLCGYYYPAYPPCLNGIVYYMDSSKLMGLDVATGEKNVVVNDVKYYHILNGYCYYVTEDNDMFRLGTEEAIAKNPVYMNSIGFMYGY